MPTLIFLLSLLGLVLIMSGILHPAFYALCMIMGFLSLIHLLSEG